MYSFFPLSTFFFLLDSHCIFFQPAIKLLDFFRNLAAGDLQITRDGRSDAEAGGFNMFSTSRTQDISKTMRDLKPLKSEDVELWVKYWDAAGLFNE